MSARPSRPRPAPTVLAVALGAALGIVAAIASWDHVLGPACERPTRDGTVSQPVCVSSGPPLWLLAACTALGVAAGLLVARRLRNR